MTLFGWDASDFDWDRGPMDLAAAYRDGISFFTHKATEATNVKHIHFGEAMHRARDAGIPFLGAYHVVRSPRNAQQEVDYFLNYVDQQFPEWRSHLGFFFQVDLEKWQYDSVPAVEGEDFADIVEIQGKKKAIIYASKGQYNNELAGTSHELWNANYPLNYQTGPYRDLYVQAGGDSGSGWARYSGRMPKIWQYTSSAKIGSQNTCDANAFRGSIEEFRVMIAGGDMSGEYSPATATAIAVGATDLGFVGQGHPVNWDSEVATYNLKAVEERLTNLIGTKTAAMSDAQFAELKTAMTAKLPTAADIVAELLNRIPRA